jgi:hypothetical protein
MADMIQIWRDMPRSEKIGGLLFTVATVAAVFLFGALAAAF